MKKRYKIEFVATVLAGIMFTQSMPMNLLNALAEGGGLAVTLGWADFGIMSSNVASLIGRGVSSTIYNFTNEWFQSGTITTDNLGLYAADVMMDLTFSILYIDYFNNGISNNIVGMILGGATDSFVDISQTFLYFSPTAQRRIRTGN